MSIDTSELAKRIRINSLKMVNKAKASHIGSALSISDIVAVLYGEVMQLAPLTPYWSQRDRFLLSKGHACVAIYSALAELGFFCKKDLLTYGEDFSPMMNHISHKVTGVEFSTGSLGHALPFGAGKALAAKMNGENWKTFVLLSDGELDEGSNWEAMMFSAHHQLDNLVAIVDYNKLQSLTSIQETLSLEPLADKFLAFGWQVEEVDGHNHSQLASALLLSNKNKVPKVVIAHTTKGKGVSFMENNVLWHYRPPSDEELTLALEELKNA